VRISWTSNAHSRLERIHAYYSEIDPRLARRIFRALKASVQRLSQFPTSGRIGEVPHTRELVVPNLPFIIVYRIAKDEIQILRVFHDAQQQHRRTS
jgi:toxin ParE1/3/4